MNPRLVSFRALAGALFVLGTAATADASIVVTTIGTPAFMPTDVHVFTAPIGTVASGFAEIVTTLEAVLPPPNHVFNPALTIGPGAPHPGPYNTEFAKGIPAAGFREGSQFSVPEFSNGNGIYLAFMVVPGPSAPIGSSPDFSSGPIIPNPTPPGTSTLRLDLTTYYNGAPVPGDTSSFDVPSTTAAGLFQPGPGNVPYAGFSHIPIFGVDSFDIPGTYAYTETVTDARGNGFTVFASFEVPEPASVLLIVPGILGLIGCSWLRGRDRVVG